jgi:hypothetical protein
MTRINNGRIISTSTSNSSKPKSKTSHAAKAILAQLDSISDSLSHNGGESVSHYGGSVVSSGFDVSVCEEMIERVDSKPKATPKAQTVTKTAVVDDSSAGSSSVEVEEVSFALSRLNSKLNKCAYGGTSGRSSSMKSMKSEEQNGEVYAEMVGGRKLIEEVKASLNASSSTFTASATAVALKKEEQSLYSIDSRSFEESIVSASSDEFSIEEEEEEEVYLAPAVPMKPAFAKRKSAKTSMSGSIQKYMQNNSLDEGSKMAAIDDVKTPKIGNHKSIAGISGAEVKKLTMSMNSRNMKSSGKSTASRSSSTGKSSVSWAENSIDTTPTNNSKVSLPSSRLSKSSSKQMTSKTASRMLIDIESGSVSRQSNNKRGKFSSSSSWKSSAMSQLDDETSDILNDAILLQRNSRKCKGTCFVVSALLALVVCASSVLMYLDLVPVPFMENEGKLSVVASLPTMMPSSSNVGDVTVDLSKVPVGVPGKQWYVDWNEFKCVQDCVSDQIKIGSTVIRGISGSSTCGGRMERWDKPFDTLSECCLESFSTFISKDWSLEDCMMVISKDTGGEQKQNVHLVNDDDDEEESSYPTDAPTYVSSDTGEPTSEVSSKTKATLAASDSFGTTAWGVTAPTRDREEPKTEKPTVTPSTIAVETTSTSTTTASTTTIVKKTTSTTDTTSSTEVWSTTESPVKITVAPETIVETTISTTSSSSLPANATVVYFADWSENKCITIDAKGAFLDEVYDSEKACCKDNFDWDKNGHCFGGNYISGAGDDAPSADDDIVADDGTVIDDIFDTMTASPPPTNVETSKPTKINTNKPSKSPVTMSPTSSPIATTKMGGKDCTQEFCDYQLESDYLLQYKVNVPDDTDVDMCSGCTISIKLTYDDEAWIGIAFSANGEMVGSEAVM